MSLITASNLGKSFGPADIFSGGTLSIPQGGRIAIVGPNGVGKTTLLRILLGLEEPSAGGLDQIAFLVSANPGQPLQPLAKVASGGELSRISLAIQVATSECGQVPSLIFDEVDVSIGGGVAEIVGQLLRRLGRSRQVLCVTHLPQVAAQAHQHLRVRKYSERERTFAESKTLSSEERVGEIARMLGGQEITKKTLATPER